MVNIKHSTISVFISVLAKNPITWDFELENLNRVYYDLPERRQIYP